MKELMQLAEYLAGLRGAILPPDVRDAAGLHLLDTLAAVTAGMGSDMDRTLRRIGGSGPEWEALVGAVLAHRHEVDDIFDDALLCIGGLVVPVAISVGKSRRASMAEVLVAIVAGYEAMGRLGLSIESAGLLKRGWWPTAVCGAFGAAAATGRLVGLDGLSMAHALALAGMNSGGLASGEGGILGRSLLYGNVARAGMLAALAAAAGLKGPLRLMEGQRSLGAAYALDADLGKLTDRLGQDFVIARTTIKPYASARQLHSAVEIVLSLLRDGLDITSIESVRVELPFESGFLDRPPDATLPVAPAASAQWVLAVALSRGSVLPTDFSPEVLGSQVVRDIANLVEVCVKDQGVRPALSASVEVRTKRQILRRETVVPKGGPSRPLGETEVLAKARALMQPILGSQADRILERVGVIGELSSADDLADLCLWTSSPKGSENP